MSNLLTDKELVEECLLTEKELLSLPRNQAQGQTEIVEKALLRKAIPIVRKAIAEEIKRELGGAISLLFHRNYSACMKRLTEIHESLDNPTGKGEG